MTSVAIFVPTHSGSVDSLTATTLLEVQPLLRDRGIDMRVTFPSGTYIPMLRNLIVADYLASTADMLLMLDSDQGIPASLILRMIDLGEEFVGHIYPRRWYDWGQAGTAPIPQQLYRAMTFVGEIEPPADGGDTVTLRDGFVRARRVGTGALLLRRSVFDRLREIAPELRGQGFDASDFPPPRFAENWGFFTPEPGAGGAPLPEDFTFCNRWRRAGGTIWADVATASSHVGRHVWQGSYVEWLAARQG